MKYEELIFKIPEQSPDYEECSRYATSSINDIVINAINQKKNQIVLHTNLRHGLPLENINKIAGPLVEAWTFETFENVFEDNLNRYQLIHVEAMPRLNMADIVLQFKRQRKTESAITVEIDVKSTSEDIDSSGKSPNITSFERIRCAYVDDPDYLFIILSIKHRVYSQPNEKGLKVQIMEIVDSTAYDLKHLSSSDISYNPALGTGQIQVRDIHYVTLTPRTTWDFCQLLDAKFINSPQKGFDTWYDLAIKNGWIKTDD